MPTQTRVRHIYSRMFSSILYFWKIIQKFADKILIHHTNVTPLWLVEIKWVGTLAKCRKPTISPRTTTKFCLSILVGNYAKSTFPLPYILQFLATYTCLTFSVPILSIMIKLSISIKFLLHLANYQLIH
jgi:hypothetical protein